MELANDYFIDSDDEVAVKVKRISHSKSIPEIVAQLKRIYRTYDEGDRRYIAGDFLRGLTQNKKDSSQPELVRGSKKELTDNNEEKLTDLAEDLLDKLGEIWGDND